MTVIINISDSNTTVWKELKLVRLVNITTYALIYGIHTLRSAVLRLLINPLLVVSKTVVNSGPSKGFCYSIQITYIAASLRHFEQTVYVLWSM